MKKLELQQIIREEIHNVLNENDMPVPDSTEYQNELKKLEGEYTKNKAGLEQLIKIYTTQIQVLRSIMNREFSTPN